MCLWTNNCTEVHVGNYGGGIYAGFIVHLFYDLFYLNNQINHKDESFFMF